MTPYEKLKSIAKTKPYLKPDITYEILNKLVMRISGDESPMQLQIERNKVIQRSLSKIERKSCNRIIIKIAFFKSIYQVIKIAFVFRHINRLK